MSSKLPWSTAWVLGKPGLHKDPILRKQKPNKNKTTTKRMQVKLYAQKPIFSSVASLFSLCIISFSFFQISIFELFPLHFHGLHVYIFACLACVACEGACAYGWVCLLFNEAGTLSQSHSSLIWLMSLASLLRDSSLSLLELQGACHTHLRGFWGSEVFSYIHNPTCFFF